MSLFRSLSDSLSGVCLSLALLSAGCGGSGGSGPPPPPVSIRIDPTSASVAAASTQQFTATVTGSSNTAVIWSVNSVEGGSSLFGRISTSGLYGAPDAIPQPSAVTVAATSVADTSKSASARVTLIAPALSLNPIVAVQGALAFTLLVDGAGFDSSSQVFLNDSGLTTTFVSATQLTAQVSPGDIAQPGTFPVTARTGATSTGAVHFYVVPPIAAQAVAVNAGAETSGIDIPVRGVTPPALSLLAAGVGDTAQTIGTSVRQGTSVSLFLVGTETVPGTFYILSGNPNDLAFAQPVIADFGQTTTDIPAVNISISVGAAATLGARNIVVTNPAGEITVFPGGLLVTP